MPGNPPLSVHGVEVTQAIQYALSRIVHGEAVALRGLGRAIGLPHKPRQHLGILGRPLRDRERVP